MLSKSKNFKPISGGFTLIELLVVVAIIGILSSVIIASLNSARDKTKLTKLRADLSGIIKGLSVAQLSSGKTILQITGTTCGAACLFDHTSKVSSQTSAVSSMTAEWGLLGFSSAPLDPWGDVYIIDPNEGEFAGNPCRYDSLFSAGPNGVFETVMIYPGGPVTGDDYGYDIPFLNCSNGSSSYGGNINNFP